MAVLIETTLNPQQLLHEILKVESKMGRVRKKKWEDRIIDIDILFYNDEVLD
nr:2-amino-4-hydroxy-6-hydroxymethyldihydropteridine diphosphokinase [Nitrosopumilus sp.]